MRKMPQKKKKLKIGKKAISAALVSAAAVGVGVALSNKKTRRALSKKVKSLEKLGKKELDEIIEKIRDAKILSSDKLKKVTKLLSDKSKKVQK
ncbi:MAG TPA: hypothetical protein VI819_01120 [Patescibacteria group bacterium]|nr:hypothetical protein [Patescibacteria group bacterium]